VALKLFQSLRPFTAAALLREFLAGLGLASIDIPQVLGYARIAGMPVVTGLYTLVLPVAVFGIFGSSRNLVVAADSATAAIVFSSVSAMAPPGSAHYIDLVGIVALQTAALLLLARIFKLGFLADFLSRTVLSGFLTGVGCQVAIAMLSDMTGIPTPSRYAIGRVWQLVRGFCHLQVSTLSLAAAVAAVLLFGSRFVPRWPLALLAVMASMAASAAFGFATHGIAVLGLIPGGLPPLRLPEADFREILALAPIAASCVVMIIAQSAATARAFAAQAREDDDANADILGLAASNLAAGLSGTFVVNGSPTQTAVAYQAGARSQCAHWVLGLVVIAVLLAATGPLQYLPRGVLAAIVFTIAVRMVEVRRLQNIRAESPGEFGLAIATAATVLAVGVEQGILVAIALSLFRHVRHSYRPHTTMLTADDAGRWLAIPATPGRVTAPGLIVYRFGADLFYANQNRFTDEVRALIERAPGKIHCFLVDAGAITDLDYSAAHGIRKLFEDLRNAGIRVIFGRVNLYLLADMDRHGLSATVGKNWIFPTLHEALAAVQSGAAGQEPIGTEP